MTWVAVVAASVGCYLAKLAGLSLPAGLLERPFVQAVSRLLPVALLAGLVAVGTFAAPAGSSLVLDARAAGLAAAVVAVVLRAPIVVVLVVAAGTTAVVRAVIG